MKAWKKALNYVLEHGDEVLDEKGRRSKEVEGLCVRINQPEADASKPVDVLAGFEKWVYPSAEEIQAFTLSKKSRTACDMSYGDSIFNYRGRVNQIDDFVIPLLKKDLRSRRAVVVLWDPEEKTSSGRSIFFGLITVHFKVIGKRLHASCFVRSNDIFFGWPGNICQLSTLQSYINEKLGLRNGPITVFSAVAQVFDEQEEDARRIINNEKI
ncbi:MAG: thymidylate synthase [Candidatus Woesearchaeota archaeon]